MESELILLKKTLALLTARIKELENENKLVNSRAGFAYKNYTITSSYSKGYALKKFTESTVTTSVFNQVVVNLFTHLRLIGRCEFVRTYGTASQLNENAFKDNRYKFNVTISNDVFNDDADTYYITEYVGSQVNNRPTVAFQISIAFLEIFLKKCIDIDNIDSAYTIYMFDLNELIIVIILHLFSDKRNITFDNGIFRINDLFETDLLKDNVYIKEINNNLTDMDKKEFIKQFINLMFESCSIPLDTLKDAELSNDQPSSTDSTYKNIATDLTEVFNRNLLLPTTKFPQINDVYTKKKFIYDINFKNSNYSDNRKLDIINLFKGSYYKYNKPLNGIRLKNTIGYPTKFTLNNNGYDEKTVTKTLNDNNGTTSAITYSDSKKTGIILEEKIEPTNVNQIYTYTTDIISVDDLIDRIFEKSIYYNMYFYV